MEDSRKIVKEFTGKKIMIIGDIMLDEYIYGDVTRINPEAPVPVLHVDRVEHHLGGAGNTTMNISSLGGNPILITRLGNDENGEIVRNLLKHSGINSVILNSESSTIKKTRIVARSQQVIRVDWEEKSVVKNEEISQIIKVLKDEDDYEVILISDYAKGMVTERLMAEIKKLGKKIIVDPKSKHFDFYNNVYAIKPNRTEALEMSGKLNTYDAGKYLCETAGSNIILTLGNKGAKLFTTDGRVFYVPTNERRVYDVVGAGDTFIATLALGISVSSDLEDLGEIVHLANLASGLVVEKLGTACVTQRELLSELDEDKIKIKTLEELKEIVRDLKERNKKVVTTNGCFDILHSGHVHLLRQAKALGDVLVLGLNTDASVKRLKGADRPINNQEERAEVLSSLGFIDYIVFFDESTPENLVRELKPDIHVKGGDYDPNNYEKMPEAKIVHSYGGQVRTINVVEGKSTSKIISKIKSR